MEPATTTSTLAVTSAARILVVEDDAALRSMLVELLADVGFQTAQAADGAAGLAAFSAARTDLVLLDASMPQMDGFELCRRLRALPQGATTPVLMITGRDDPAAVDAAFAAGVTDFIAKPLNLTVLEHRIRRLLAARAAETALRESEERYRRLIETSPDAIALTDLEGTLLFANRQAAALFGFENADVMVGMDGFALLAPEDRPHAREKLATVLAGDTVRDVELSGLRRDRSRLPLEARVSVVRDSDGQPHAIMGVLRDITERKRAAEAQRLLAEASAQLAASLDYDITLQRIARLALTTFADLCIVYILEEDGTIRRSELAHRDPAKEACLRALRARNPADRDELHPILQVLRSGRSQLIPNISESFLAQVARDAEARRVLRELGFTSAMLVPLLARGRVLGALAFGSVEPQRSYGPADLQLAEELGRRAGLAVDNAQLYASEHQARQAAERAADRTSRLQTVTAALAQALTPAQVAAAVVDQGVAALEASAGSIVLQAGDGSTIEVVRAAGYAEDVAAPWRQFPITAPVPLAEAVRTGKPSFLESPEAWRARYPDTSAVAASTHNSAWAAIPLQVEDRVLGALGLSFGESRVFGPEDRAFMLALARLCAQALERTRLYEAERQARARATAAEAVLAESEERYRLIAEHTGDLVAMLDREGHYLYASPSHRQVLGYDAAGLIGASFFDRIHPDDQASIQAQWTRITTEGTAQATFRYHHADGSWCWFEATGTAVERQAVAYIIVVGRDVTVRKALEAQLIQGQKLESVGRLAGGIAHDFNNLLMVITGYLELMEPALLPDASIRNDLDQIRQASQRAVTLTRQLLAFASRQIIEPRVLDLNELLLELKKLLRRLIGEDIELTTLTAPGLGRVRADPGQIEQVVVNLAVNARDAMPNGGRITLETQNVYLDDAYAHQHIDVTPGRYVKLAVTDSGVGMSADVQAHVFEPFFTTKDVGRGTGLGLAICYGIVKQHGGHIRVSSQVGRGTTISIYLPEVEAATETSPERDTEAALPRGTETVLVVEDEPAVRELVTRVLREQGYTLLEATQGNEALQVARAYADVIDLVVTDVVMPQSGGKAVVEQLVTLYPNIKAVFISGYMNTEMWDHGEPDLRMAFVQKPVSPTALARTVRALLDT